MPNNRAIDSFESPDLAWPYVPNGGDLSGAQCFSSGENMYVSWGGTLRTRLGTSVIGSTVAVTARPERLWVYETLDATPVIYVVGSFKNGSVYELRYQQMSPTPGNWTTASELRGSNHSRWPHEGCVRRGRLYLKGFPADADDTSKLGCVILDGTGGSMAIKPWGSMGPSTPARLTSPTVIAISAVTNASPAVLTTASPHGLISGQYVSIGGFGGGWASVNSTRFFVVTVTGPTTFSIPVDSTAFGAIAGSPTIGWTASTHSITVNYGWTYVYTYVQSDGHETNRSPIETDPDKSPSSVSGFSNLLPEMLFVPNTDTTTYPYINVYRTTDGGGTFFFIKQIANPGGSLGSFQDKYLASTTGGNNDPLPDRLLDTSKVAPSENSNSPPPSVAPPQVTGTDTIKRCTEVVEHAGRLWYMIDEYLFYSAQEELNQGIPEEAFPSGIASPNFFRFTKAGVYLRSTPQGLLVILRDSTQRIIGTTRAAFNPRPFLHGIGGAMTQRRGSTGVGENVVWVTQDYKLVRVSGDNYDVLSNPLGSLLKTLADDGTIDFEPRFWSQGDKEWLVLSAHNLTASGKSLQLIYDLDKSREKRSHFWFTPWRIKMVASAVGQSAPSDTENRFFVGLWNGTNFQLAVLDQAWALATDPTPGAVGTLTGFAYFVTPGLQGVPLGNHVNERRAPDLSATLKGFQIEQTNVSSGVAPTMVAYLDDLETTSIPLTAPIAPPGRPQSKGYTTRIYNSPLWTNCKRATFKLSQTATSVRAEYHAFLWNWSPESGM